MTAFSSQAEDAPVNETWYRQPAISPDGQSLLFTARGDIWRVSAEGGTATPLTIDDSWEGFPVWSHDGSKIAFASDKYGDLDIFVMHADGSGLKRLTYHDATDRPTDFSPDGQRVLFNSARTDSAASSYFPTGALPELYEIDVDGGAPRMVFTNPAREARWSADGRYIVYREEKSYENEWRQRDVNAFARDVWRYDTKTGQHVRLTDNPAGDHSPVFGERADILYLVSEIDGGTFNLRKIDTASGHNKPLTTHTTHPVRGLSRSTDGTLAYSWHGHLFTTTDGGESRQLGITLAAPRLNGGQQPLPAANISEFAVSPSGDEIAFISRGEIFVTDAEFSATVQITRTPEQERSVSFSPDGQSLLYAAEYGEGWAIHESIIADDNAPRFSAASRFAAKPVYAVADGTAFQPRYSPDGESIAFIENRDAIRVMDRDGKNVRTVFPARFNYSYSDGDISFDWSPDSQWIVADYSPRGYWFYKDVGIAPADGSAPPRDISLSGYHDGQPQWHSSGDVIFWRSDRYGERSHGSWGAEEDVVAAFLTESGWLRYNLTDQEFSLLEELDQSEDTNSEDSDDDNGSDDIKKVVDIRALLNLPEATEDDTIDIDFAAVEDRTIRLTVHASDLAGAALTEDLSALFYLARTEGGYDLWRHKLRDDETSRVAKLDAGSADIALLKDDKGIVVLADGRLLHGELGDSIDLSPVDISGEMALNAHAERQYLFDHVWRQVEDKFYDPDFHGVDWAAMRIAYRPKVAALDNNRDFATLMSEMLGQLNASHTGMYYRPRGNGDADATASLGAIFSTDNEPGLIIEEILPGGPLDRARFDVLNDDRIVAINGTRLDNTTNPWRLLNRQAGEVVRLTLSRGGKDLPAIRTRAWRGGEERNALYERWIERRRAIVENRSKGRIGYFHIRSMDDDGFRQAFSELFGRNFDKEAVVVDTRFNGGGWLHDDLLKLLDGKRYFNMGQRGRIVRGAPEESWTRPSALVMNEGNYSNAHMFPYAYKHFSIGPLVGMPVPGTATAVWWERLMTGDLTFGIPQMPILDDNDQPLENQELQPDYEVDNLPADAAKGKDRPLETAVDQLLKTLDD